MGKPRHASRANSDPARPTARPFYTTIDDSKFTKYHQIVFINNFLITLCKTNDEGVIL